MLNKLNFIYIRKNACGLANGRDWENAYLSLPKTLIRGKTYYISSDMYNNYICNDPSFGINIINIKKATVLDHGTNHEWENSYEESDVIFNEGISVLTENWNIDSKIFE